MCGYVTNANSLQRYILSVTVNLSKYDSLYASRITDVTRLAIEFSNICSSAKIFARLHSEYSFYP